MKGRPHYMFLVSPSKCEEIKQHPDFVSVEKYAENIEAIEGEIGSIWGYRICKTSDLPKWETGGNKRMEQES